jgi:hypothetical protein
MSAARLVTYETFQEHREKLNRLRRIPPRGIHADERPVGREAVAVITPPVKIPTAALATR